MKLTFSFDHQLAVTDTGIRLRATRLGSCGDCRLSEDYQCPGTEEAKCLASVRKDHRVIIWEEVQG